MTSEKSRSESFVYELHRLHREFLRGLDTTGSEVERQIEKALDACLEEFSRIEASSSADLRSAAEEYGAAERAAVQPGTFEARSQYQRKVCEMVAKAKEQADSARVAYVAAWRKAGEESRELRHKARLDYLALVRERWSTLDLSRLGVEEAEALVVMLHGSIRDSLDR